MSNATEAHERIQKLTPLRKFKIGYAIYGELEIEATDAEAAERATWNYSKEQLAERGELDVFEPVPEVAQ
jgi:hypothetical protein